ncbi:hypothetical protein Pla175_02190 [Pirellulimonas nuda]|uniref:Uncharacterized protein n=1 Tax=Pirellulimonas nuda TaxID=2528009 RepID=A0A518D5W5_9BACT|nr:hypothetical protein [Pirellulimonas nuda]QDU86866.1 hypothetical protein Pla175_02190 [Pirellulimonas nuda]
MHEDRGNGPSTFVPRPVLVLGIALWLLLTVAGCWREFAENDYPAAVLLFGIGITALAMACVSAWCVMLAALLLTWSLPSRRGRFRAELSEWTLSFLFITAVGVALLFLGD